jgi:ankyrin repeat protein
MRICLSILLSLVSWCPDVFAQESPSVDFKRDVQPLLKEHCISCHGPSLQMNGFRLDRRSTAMRGTARAPIVPRNSAVSSLYLRLSGTGLTGPGGVMPPTGRLSDSEIAVFKNWIDQGAEWPDDVAGEVEGAPADPGAVRLMEALRNADDAGFKAELATNPASAGARGVGGNTPLMYGALYGNAESVRTLLEHGANPNVSNNEGTTALMWAVDSVEKTRLLLDAGAAIDARTEGGRTALLIAAGRHGSTNVVKLLINRGANAAVIAENRTTALQLAARSGDEEAMRLLLAHGANLKADAPAALNLALRSDCTACIALVIDAVEPRALGNSLVTQAQFGNVAAVKLLLQRGASVNATTGAGVTPLMAACNTDAASAAVVQLLLDAGADVSALTKDSTTALNLAQRRSSKTILDLLRKAGARDEPEMMGVVASHTVPIANNSVMSAVQRSLPLLQHSDEQFAHGSGCVSCHNNSLTAMTVAAARRAGFGVKESTARAQLQWTAGYAEIWRETALRGVFNGGPDAVSYILAGMAEEHYNPDAATDALAYLLKGSQMPNGQWRSLGGRPPLEYSDLTTTANAVRSLQTFAPKPHRAGYAASVERAAAWLIAAQPYGIEEQAYQLLGLKWAGADLKADAVQRMIRSLLAEQQPDGGWAPLPGMQSDAYATGQALVALHESGGADSTTSAYTRGVEYLLRTQLEDGSWHVKTRATPAQPYFESGFPHGKDQFISIAASNWATMALVLAESK